MVLNFEGMISADRPTDGSMPGSLGAPDWPGLPWNQWTRG